MLVASTAPLHLLWEAQEVLFAQLSAVIATPLLQIDQ